MSFNTPDAFKAAVLNQRRFLYFMMNFHVLPDRVKTVFRDIVPKPHYSYIDSVNTVLNSWLTNRISESSSSDLSMIMRLYEEILKSGFFDTPIPLSTYEQLNKSSAASNTDTKSGPLSMGEVSFSSAQTIVKDSLSQSSSSLPNETARPTVEQNEVRVSPPTNNMTVDSRPITVQSQSSNESMDNNITLPPLSLPTIGTLSENTLPPLSSSQPVYTTFQNNGGLNAAPVLAPISASQPALLPQSLTDVQPQLNTGYPPSSVDTNAPPVNSQPNKSDLLYERPKLVQPSSAFFNFNRLDKRVSPYLTPENIASAILYATNNRQRYRGKNPRLNLSLELLLNRKSLNIDFNDAFDEDLRNMTDWNRLSEVCVRYPTLPTSSIKRDGSFYKHLLFEQEEAQYQQAIEKSLNILDLKSDDDCEQPVLGKDGLVRLEKSKQNNVNSPPDQTPSVTVADSVVASVTDIEGHQTSLTMGAADVDTLFFGPPEPVHRTGPPLQQPEVNETIPEPQELTKRTLDASAPATVKDNTTVPPEINTEKAPERQSIQISDDFSQLESEVLSALAVEDDDIPIISSRNQPFTKPVNPTDESPKSIVEDNSSPKVPANAVPSDRQEVTTGSASLSVSPTPSTETVPLADGNANSSADSNGSILGALQESSTQFATKPKSINETTVTEEAAPSDDNPKLPNNESDPDILVPETKITAEMPTVTPSIDETVNDEISEQYSSLTKDAGTASDASIDSALGPQLSFAPKPSIFDAKATASSTEQDVATSSVSEADKRNLVESDTTIPLPVSDATKSDVPDTFDDTSEDIILTKEVSTTLSANDTIEESANETDTGPLPVVDSVSTIAEKSKSFNEIANDVQKVVASDETNDLIVSEFLHPHDFQATSTPNPVALKKIELGSNLPLNEDLHISPLHSKQSNPLESLTETEHRKRTFTELAETSDDQDELSSIDGTSRASLVSFKQLKLDSIFGTERESKPLTYRPVLERNELVSTSIAQSQDTKYTSNENARSQSPSLADSTGSKKSSSPTVQSQHPGSLEEKLMMSSEGQPSKKCQKLTNVSFDEIERSRQKVLDTFSHAKTGFPEYKCVWVGCEAVLHSFENLYNHCITAHCIEKEGAFPCFWQACKASPSKSREQWKLHVHVHLNSLVYSCPMRGCKETFNNYSELSSHFEAQHSHSEYEPSNFITIKPTEEPTGRSRLFDHSMEGARFFLETNTPIVEDAPPEWQPVPPPGFSGAPAGSTSLKNNPRERFWNTLRKKNVYRDFAGLHPPRQESDSDFARPGKANGVLRKHPRSTKTLASLVEGSYYQKKNWEIC
ncbi:cryptic loci regulator Clr1 [Schizosaccharomyces japonicus yFS275]|uniref:Cryptic loci regulator Clr1 n=1 Tax=Schizosaccharomyces japonicus (strain yFS275 / FY16936) TaxID=402676 RepID=B6JX08_SCHJY|nr:cryptic loci regulator Clr1 [Schizosaccharomyces japonicus yFS275]EEB05909.1 cryptic loci regulator Clr1 [Schizosaccharomyces japonicus yFS275]